MIYRIARAVLWVLFHFAFRLRVVGLENLPAGKGFIVASNHRSNCDPVFIGISLHPTLTFMAKAELFRTPVVGRFFGLLGAFPVERGKGDSGALEFAEKTVEDGKVLGMFPEGTRSRDGKLGQLKSGCAVIAAKAGAVVVPAAVCFGEKLRPFCRVTVRFGKPIAPAELGLDPQKPSTIRKGNRLLADRISALLDEGVA